MSGSGKSANWTAGCGVGFVDDVVPRRGWDVNTIVLFFRFADFRPTSGRGSVKTELKNATPRAELSSEWDTETLTHTHTSMVSFDSPFPANVCFLWLGVWRVCFRIPLQQTFPDPSSKWHPHKHTRALIVAHELINTHTHTHPKDENRFSTEFAGSKRPVAFRMPASSCTTSTLTPTHTYTSITLLGSCCRFAGHTLHTTNLHTSRNT